MVSFIDGRDLSYMESLIDKALLPKSSQLTCDCYKLGKFPNVIRKLLAIVS